MLRGFKFNNNLLERESRIVYMFLRIHAFFKHLKSLNSYQMGIINCPGPQIDYPTSLFSNRYDDVRLECILLIVSYSLWSDCISDFSSATSSFFGANCCCFYIVQEVKKRPGPITESYMYAKGEEEAEE